MRDVRRSSDASTAQARPAARGCGGADVRPCGRYDERCRLVALQADRGIDVEVGEQAIERRNGRQNACWVSSERAAATASSPDRLARVDVRRRPHKLGRHLALPPAERPPSSVRLRPMLSRPRRDRRGCAHPLIKRSIRPRWRAGRRRCTARRRPARSPHACLARCPGWIPVPTIVSEPPGSVINPAASRGRLVLDYLHALFWVFTQLRDHAPDLSVVAAFAPRSSPRRRGRSPPPRPPDLRPTARPDPRPSLTWDHEVPATDCVVRAHRLPSRPRPLIRSTVTVCGQETTTLWNDRPVASTADLGVVDAASEFLRARASLGCCGARFRRPAVRTVVSAGSSCFGITGPPPAGSAMPASTEVSLPASTRCATL